MLRDTLVHLGVKASDILIVNSETPEEERRLLFINIETAIVPFRVMLTTSTLTVGVDINPDHFKTAIGVYTAGTASIQ